MRLNLGTLNRPGCLRDSRRGSHLRLTGVSIDAYPLSSHIDNLNVAKRPSPAISALQRDLNKLEILYDSSANSHDCSELAQVLSRHSDVVGRALLVGQWTDPKETKCYYILSASFWVADGTHVSLDQLSEAQSLLREKDLSTQALAKGLGLENDVAVVCKPNATCFFTDAFPANFRERVATHYQRMLLSSHNLDNFFDGQNYHASKPPGEGDVHPRFTSYAEVSEAIKDHFGIGASYFVYFGTREAEEADESHFRMHDKKKLSDCLPFRQDEEFRRKLKAAIGLKQPIIGHSADQPYYGIYPAYDHSIRRSPVEGVMIAWSDEPLTLPAAKAATSWLRERSARRHVEKARFLTAFRRHTKDALDKCTADLNHGRASRRASLESVSNYLCEKICELTNAESATVRLLHNTKEIVPGYGRAATPLGQYTSEDAGRPIKLGEWQSSAIAFAFHHQTNEPDIYIPDTKHIPEVYGLAGLQSVIEARETTRCEAVFRVRRGGLLAAVINVESPIVNSLHHERGFLRDCALILSDYLSQLETVRDWFGLATIAETQVQVHAVKSDVLAWRPGDGPGAESIVARLQKRMQGEASTHSEFATDVDGITIDTKNPDRGTRSFNQAWQERIDKHLREMGSDVGVGSVLRGEIPHDFPVSKLPSLIVIMDSIWKNIVEHSRLQENSLIFSLSEQPFAMSRVLTLHWHAPSQLPVALDRDRIFLQPLESEKGPHFGFFLIGVHTRLLGGHVELELHEPPDAGFSVLCFIPFEPELRDRP